MTSERPTAGDDVPDRFRVDFTGLTLNRVYRVEQKIADGGMGSIYLAEDTNLGRPVVVKVPHPRFLGEPGFRSRFSREVEELVRLEHPHIARILARGEHEEVPYFVLQYLGGGSLEDRIIAAEGRPAEPEEVLVWLTDVATTLDFVHEQGLVHRDVKPANILFDEAGNVFLSDFGVAKVVGSDSAITGTGVGIGSPKYMAPEQGMGREVGPAADQYALAGVVYEALAGTPPFEGDTPIEIFVKKGQQAAIPIVSRVPGLPEAAADAVMKALTMDPVHRFRNCSVLAQSFRAGLAEAGMATPDRTPSHFDLPLVRPRRRPRWPLALAVLACVLVLLTLILTGRTTGPTPDEEGRPEVFLLDPGAQPRRVLRLVIPPDLVQRLRTEHSFTMDLTGEGLEQVVTEPTTGAADSEFRVVPAENGIAFTWEILDTPASGLVGVTARGTMSDRGWMRSLESTSSADLPPGTAVALSHIAAMVRQLPVPFPEQPVGIGARWEVTETVRFLGMRMVQTSTYELLELDVNRVKVHVATAETAAPGESLSFGAGPKLRIASLVAHGEGDVSLDLGLLLPHRSQITIDMDITGRLDLPEGPVARRIEFHVESLARPVTEKR